MADKAVYAWAARESRIILTFDKDFGDLARVAGLAAPSGIVLFRLPMPPRTKVGADVADIINSHSQWAGHFTVVERDRIRTRKLIS
jgi:predicted nuclease of predicted toxin-antitoxin system